MQGYTQNQPLLSIPPSDFEIFRAVKQTGVPNAVPLEATPRSMWSRLLIYMFQRAGPALCSVPCPFWQDPLSSDNKFIPIQFPSFSTLGTYNTSLVLQG